MKHPPSDATAMQQRIMAFLVSETMHGASGTRWMFQNHGRGRTLTAKCCRCSAFVRTLGQHCTLILPHVIYISSGVLTLSSLLEPVKSCRAASKSSRTKRSCADRGSDPYFRTLGGYSGTLFCLKRVAKCCPMRPCVAGGNQGGISTSR